jgi:hypothetical protein
MLFISSPIFGSQKDDTAAFLAAAESRTPRSDRELSQSASRFALTLARVKHMGTALLILIIALVSSGALFLALRWMGVIGTEVVAEISDEQQPKPPV